MHYISRVKEPFTKHIIYILLYLFVSIFIWKRVSVSFDLLGMKIIKTKAANWAWWWKYIATAIWSVRFEWYKELLIMNYVNESNTCGDEFAKLIYDKDTLGKPYSVLYICIYEYEYLYITFKWMCHFTNQFTWFFLSLHLFQIPMINHSLSK